LLQLSEQLSPQPEHELVQLEQPVPQESLHLPVQPEVQALPHDLVHEPLQVAWQALPHPLPQALVHAPEHVLKQFSEHWLAHEVVHEAVQAVWQVVWQEPVHWTEQAAVQAVPHTPEHVPAQLPVPPWADSASSAANPKAPQADKRPLPRVLMASRRSILRSSSPVRGPWLAIPSCIPDLL
jgi:hypothetical protein